MTLTPGRKCFSIILFTAFADQILTDLFSEIDKNHYIQEEISCEESHLEVFRIPTEIFWCLEIWLPVGLLQKSWHTWENKIMTKKGRCLQIEFQDSSIFLYRTCINNLLLSIINHYIHSLFFFPSISIFNFFRRKRNFYQIYLSSSLSSLLSRAKSF